jgi:hypothetical protein
MVVLQRLAREPTAVGTVVASVLPALVALRLVSMDEQAIGVVVVAVNAVAGFALRMLVTPRGPVRTSGDAVPDPATG